MLPRYILLFHFTLVFLTTQSFGSVTKKVKWCEEALFGEDQSYGLLELQRYNCQKVTQCPVALPGGNQLLYWSKPVSQKSRSKIQKAPVNVLGACGAVTSLVQENIDAKTQKRNVFQVEISQGIREIVTSDILVPCVVNSPIFDSLSASSPIPAEVDLCFLRMGRESAFGKGKGCRGDDVDTNEYNKDFVDLADCSHHFIGYISESDGNDYYYPCDEITCESIVETDQCAAYTAKVETFTTKNPSIKYENGLFYLKSGAKARLETGVSLSELKKGGKC